MNNTILVVDDEWDSPIVKAVLRTLESEGWSTRVIRPESVHYSGEEFEAEALYAIQEAEPDGVLLDVRLGEYKEDQFKGLDILHKIISSHP